MKSYILDVRTGEAKISKGYNCPARFIIHTVGPKYNLKYKTAAETALHFAYRNVLSIARENEISSIAIAPINSLKRGYPPDEGAHIALRKLSYY